MRFIEAIAGAMLFFKGKREGVLWFEIIESDVLKNPALKGIFCGIFNYVRWSL